MFEKLKKANQLRKMKKKLKGETAFVEKEGVKVKVNGEMKVESIEIDSEVDKEKSEDLLPETINEAMEKVQRKAAKKFSEMQ